jgi:phage terminase small subunit
VAVTRAQKQFVARFIEQDFRNATAAYRKAYPNASAESARREASRLLTKVDIQEHMSAAIAGALRREKVTLEKRILDIWLKRAFYDPGEIIDDSGVLLHSLRKLKRMGLSVCVEGIETRRNAAGVETVRVRLADRDKALEMLQKYIRMIHEKIELGIKDDTRLVDLKNLLLEKAEQSPEERDRIVAELDRLTGNGE